jgi:TRAP-type C4-dicarboxylate transport system permease small subunit
MNGDARRRIETWLARSLAAAAGTLLLALMLLTLCDVLGRYLLARPVPGAFELTKVAMALLIFAGLPLVTARDGHITIGLLDNLFRGRLAAFRDLLIALLCGATVGVIAWRLWVLAGRLADYGDLFEFIGLPQAVPAYAMSVLAAATAAVLLAKALAAARRLAEPTR